MIKIYLIGFNFREAVDLIDFFMIDLRDVFSVYYCNRRTNHSRWKWVFHTCFYLKLVQVM